MSGRILKGIFIKRLQAFLVFLSEKHISSTKETLKGPLKL
jgi:hypothetical protein